MNKKGIRGDGLRALSVGAGGDLRYRFGVRSSWRGHHGGDMKLGLLAHAAGITRDQIHTGVQE